MNSIDSHPELIDPEEARRRLALWPIGVSRAAIELLDLRLDDQEALRPAALTDVVNALSQDTDLADQPDFQALFEKLQAACVDMPTHLDPSLQIGWISGSLRTSEWAMPDGIDLLLIEGDLEVKGVWSDAGNCERSGVVVQGSLRAGNLLNSGCLVVGGDVQTRILMSNSGNDAYLWVQGDCLATELVLENGQHMHFGGALRSPLIISVHNRVEADAGVHGQLFDHESETLYLACFLAAYRTERDVTEWDGTAWRVTGSEPCVDFERVWRDLALGRMVLTGVAG